VVGTLFVVATPIGNLDDLTLRAARVLGEVDLIAVENTQTASKLLRHLQISTTTSPYNDRNKARATGRIIAALRAGEDVALTTDAGTPGLSDPGQDLVRDAIAIGARVVPVPGASAAAALLSVAGVRTRTAHFIGFLPRKAGERQRLLASIAERGEPAVAFESPRRIVASLTAIATVMPTAHLVIGREMTKLHEEIWRGAPADAVAHFHNPRGEFSLLIVPRQPQPETWSDDAVRTALRRERDAGQRRPAASAAVALLSNRPRREVYALWPDG
jgi:16S rRNA (cytidine1402-2'-O)-methyltransferase